MTTSPATYWRAVENFARYYGPGWVQQAAKENPLKYRFSIRRPAGMRTAYADWYGVLRDARQDNGFVHPEFLAAMCWYSNAVNVQPDYHLARVSPDARLRELAARQSHRYDDVLAPLLPWHTLEHAPIGGRWDDARWVALLAHNGGPYKPVRRL